MELFNLKGKKVIITGGNRGLGKSIVEGYLHAGMEVAIIARTPSLTSQVKEYCDKGQIAYAVFADLSDRKARGLAFDEAVAKLGGLDVLVNVAGIQIRHQAEEFPLDDFDKVIEINLNATFDYCQRAARIMIPNKYGKIINFASMLSFFGGYTVSAYAASKGGVAQITKAFSNEWASKGINVNAIAPGYMATEMNTALINNPVRNDAILARIPAGRWGTGEDCVGPALFLASQASDYLSGMIMPVDGGFMSR
ncbi:MAG: SDR family NAD(P)-dependent oxidoreductase [Peptostreptococcaceae bacterium]|nr:SDR family NAD(P)-dependent oxidoreductase [Peptostreptococcaceae bacterium]